MVGPCFVVHYLLSSFAIHLLGKKVSWLLYFNCLLRSFDSKCSVCLPRGAVGWSAVCDCDVFSSYSLTFSCYLLSSILKNPNCKHHLHGSAIS